MTTDPGDYVIDLFSGGGSAGVAAKQMGRKYLGTDIDKQYAQAAAEKIKKARATKHNGEYVSIYLKKLCSVRSDYEQKQ